MAHFKIIKTIKLKEEDKKTLESSLKLLDEIHDELRESYLYKQDSEINDLAAEAYGAYANLSDFLDALED